jgi:hypothetical protein
MPALYLFQKRTLLGGDDLHLPAFFTIVTRLVQICLLALPLGIWLVHDAKNDSETFLVYVLVDPSDQDECRHSHYFPLLSTVHLLTTVVFGLASIFLEHRIWYWTCQGTPTIREPRSTKIQGLLEFKFFVLTTFLFLVLLTFLSANAFAGTYLACHRLEDDSTDKIAWLGSRSWWALSVLLFFSQVMETFMVVVFLTRLFNQSRNQHHHYHQEVSEEIISDRCHFMCKVFSVATCCLFGGRDLVQNHNPAVATYNIYQQLAVALSEYLETRGTLDVVPTDLITGLLLVQKLQRQRILKARIQVIRSSNHQQIQSVNTSGLLSSNHNNINNINGKVKLRRTRSGCNSPALSALSSPQQSSQSGPLSPSSSSLLINAKETNHLMNVTSLDKHQQLLYRRVSGMDTLYYEARMRQVLDPHNPLDCERIQEGARMAKFALAIYTWMLYVFDRPISGLPKICCRSCQVCCSHRRRQSRRLLRRRPSGNTLLEELENDDEEDSVYDSTVGDNICGWHKHALLLVAELEETDLVYAQFENRFSKMPYCILLDHASHAIIVSIRGSLSLEDLVSQP